MWSRGTVESNLKWPCAWFLHLLKIHSKNTRHFESPCSSVSAAHTHDHLSLGGWERPGTSCCRRTNSMRRARGVVGLGVPDLEVGLTWNKASETVNIWQDILKGKDKIFRKPFVWGSHDLENSPINRAVTWSVLTEPPPARSSSVSTGSDSGIFIVFRFSKVISKKKQQQQRKSLPSFFHTSWTTPAFFSILFSLCNP